MMHRKNHLYDDITLADFRYGFDIMASYHNIYDADIANKFVIRQDADWVKGVRIMCVQDFSHNKSSKDKHTQEVYLKHQEYTYQEVEGSHRPLAVALSHPIFANGKQVLSSTFPMEMRLRIDILSNNLHPNFPCIKNIAMLHLMVETSLTSDHWGKLAMSDLPHSVIIARDNKTDLSLIQVLALSWYFKGHVLPAMLKVQESEIPTGGSDTTERQKVVEEYMNFNKFVDYFVSRAKELSKKDKTWKDAKPPTRDV